MRLIITSDWELTTARLPIARKILEELAKHSTGDRIFFCGDMFREYNAATSEFAREIIKHLKVHCGMEDEERPILIVGNHDREIGANRLNALFGNDRAFVVNGPMIDKWSLFNFYAGYLPAPDRAAFGASRGAEGRKVRDAALSEALEAALISLETEIGPENLGRAILFFHGAVSSDELAPGQLASGLTWSIPAARLQRWGLAIGGHIHRPGKIGENIYSVGGIANWTFSDRAERFRALVVDTDTLEVSEIPLLRVLVPIELDLQTDGIHHDSGPPYGVRVGDVHAFATDISDFILGGAGCELADTVALKIRARLPQHEMALVPSADELKDAINDILDRPLIDSCIITREVTGLHKARLTTEQSAREMTLEDMLDLYVEASGNDTAPGTIDLAKQLLGKIADFYKPGESTFGFAPLSLEISNFRQWGDARIDFTALEGAVALWGRNETGKTNLIEAVPFALYKRSPSSTSSIEDELRLGETRGHVALSFEARGHTYLLRRAFERGKGGVSCKSEFMRADVEPMEPVCDTASGVDKAVIDLIGSYDFFLSTAFRAQRDLHRLIEATPAIWNKLFHEGLNLDCLEPVRKYGANNAENAALQVTQANLLIRDYEQSAAALFSELAPADMSLFEQWKLMIGEINGLKYSAESPELREQLAAVEARIAEAEVIKASLGQQREAQIEHRAAIRQQINARAELEGRLCQAERALKEIKIVDLGPRPTPIEPWEDASAERLEHLEAQIKEADQKFRDTSGKLVIEKENFKAAVRAVESLTQAINETQLRLDAWDKARAQMPKAECDNTDWPETKFACWYFVHTTKPETGKRLMDEMASYEAKREAKCQDIDAARAKIEAFDAMMNDDDRRSEELRRQYVDVDTKLKALAKLQAAIEAYDLKAKAQEQLVAQQAARREEIATLEEQLKLAPDAAAELSEILQEIEHTENRIGAQDGIIKAARGAIRDIEAQISKRQHVAEQITRLEAQITARRKEAADHGADQLAWGLIATAYHHTAIPYLLMERVIGDFEHTANELLDGTGMTISAETVTPTKKGEARDKLSLRFTDARGQHALSQASGEQGMLLSIALSAALSITGSQFWGATPELYIQDEGWGTLDAEHLEIAREMIARIAARFTRFIYITHVTPLAESADLQLRVEADGGVSRLVA